MIRSIPILILALILLSSCKHKEHTKTAPSTLKTLLFTKTEGYRHSSIPAGIQMFKEQTQHWRLSITETEDSKVFMNSELKDYGLIVLLNTTGDIFTNEQQEALRSYINNGGSILGIHAAADAEYGWPWYGQMLGAWFDSHPAIQQASCEVRIADHPATTGISNPWRREDEWYNFRSLQQDTHILITIDERSYTGGTNGTVHPISWYRNFEGGKIFYTAMGHTEASYKEPMFIKHIGGAIEWLRSE